MSHKMFKMCHGGVALAAGMEDRQKNCTELHASFFFSILFLLKFRCIS